MVKLTPDLFYEMVKDKIPEFVKILFEIYSPIHYDQELIAKAILNLFCREHRTGQQHVIRLLSEILREYSKKDYDNRNEDAVAYCKKIAKIDNNFKII